VKKVVVAFLAIAACHANCGDSSEEGSPQPISAPNAAVDEAGAPIGIPRPPRRMHMRETITAPTTNTE